MIDLINRSFKESQLNMNLSISENSLFEVKEKVIKETKKLGLF